MARWSNIQLTVNLKRFASDAIKSFKIDRKALMGEKNMNCGHARILNAGTWLFTI
jgi:hypothetical protein